MLSCESSTIARTEVNTLNISVTVCIDTLVRTHWRVILWMRITVSINSQYVSAKH